MYRATIFRRQELASAIAAASRDKRAYADQPDPGEYNRAWTRKEIVKREPRQIGFAYVLRDPMKVCRN